MKQSIVHIAIVVKDYDEAIDFYVNKLKFELVEDTYQPEQDKRWVVVSPPGSNGVTLLLARASKPEQLTFVGNQTGGRVFLFLNTDDFWRDYHHMIAESNGQLVKIAKGSGELVWHKHDNEDELFIVFKGQLTLQLRTENITLNAGEMYVVPKGVEHCPKALPNTHFMMVEPASTAHTGATVSEIVSSDQQEWI